MRKIEGHFHVGFGGFSAEKIIEYLDKKNIEKCWLLSWEEKNPPIPSFYEHLPIDNILEAYKKYPDRIVPFYAPDPQTENLKEKLNNYVKQGVRGCGELKVTYKWEDEIIDNYLKIISELNIPILFHMEAPRKYYVRLNNSISEKIIGKLFNGVLNRETKYNLSNLSEKIPVIDKRISKGIKLFPGYLYDFANLESCVKKYPNLKFIGHGPFFWSNIAAHQPQKYMHPKGKIKEWGAIDNLLEKYDNFYCDISGRSGFNALTRDKKKAKFFLEKHNSKLIFGTDNTPFDFDEMLNSYKLSKEKLENIYYKNAEKIIPNTLAK